MYKKYNKDIRQSKSTIKVTICMNIKSLVDTIPGWLMSVKDTEEVGRFRPCVKGLTPAGHNASLGFSCLGMKLYRTLGMWEKTSVKERDSWGRFIMSYQSCDHGREGAFIDESIISNCNTLWARIMRRFSRIKHSCISYEEAITVAETKQAYATLYDVGIRPRVIYRYFPETPLALRFYLREGLNWFRPWSAGGQAAAIAVFIALEAPRYLTAAEVKGLKGEMAICFENMVDDETGAWFRGRPPDHGDLINGSMKVLNALEWIDCKIPYPERLIDTCISARPRSEGCHLVDAVYVLYRCSKETNYRREALIKYCREVLDIIGKHHKPDGGYSYYLSHNQTHYYGAKIARPKSQSDIHGTFLLLWAIAMITDIISCDNDNIRVLKV